MFGGKVVPAQVPESGVRRRGIVLVDISASLDRKLRWISATAKMGNESQRDG